MTTKIIRLSDYKKRVQEQTQAKQEGLSAEQYIRTVFGLGIIKAQSKTGLLHAIDPYDRKALAKLCLQRDDVENIELFVTPQMWYINIRGV
jgi:hypothetical protein